MPMNAGQLLQALVDNGITATSTQPVTLIGVGSLKEVNIDTDGVWGPVGGLWLPPET